MAAWQMDHGMPAVVPLPAEIDITNAEEIVDQICAALEPGVTTVIADLTATIFCDSSGVRHLLLAHRRASASGIQLRFAVPAASPVRRILAFTGTDQVIAVYPTLDEAVSGGLVSARPGSLEGTTEEPPAQPTG
jgi:anti-sigma B factor antagonist